MNISLPREIENNKLRVGILPWKISEYKARGRIVLLETNAGLGVGYYDLDCEAAGEEICATAKEVWSGSSMIAMDKEPYHTKN